MAQKKKKSSEQRNATHMLRYLFQIEQAIRNGEYPNANKLNEKLRTDFSRSTFGRYIDILRDEYGAPIEFDFRKNGYYYTDSTFSLNQVMLKEGELLTLSTILPLLEQYNIRNIKICCISFSSSGNFISILKVPGGSSKDLYATYYHFQSVLTILFFLFRNFLSALNTCCK